MEKIDLNKLLQGRQIKDTDELNQILQAEMQRLNDAPRPEFFGVTPNQMRFLLYDPFAEGSPFGFRDFDPAVLDSCPFFVLAEDMLRQTVLSTNPFKLTVSTASLPVKTVKTLYEHLTLKDDWIEKGINHLYKETDCDQIHICKIVLEQAGIVRKQKGKWHLTKKGQKLSQPSQRAVLFREIFHAFTLKYNWAYLDAYDHPQAGQMAFAFSLSMLAHFGGTERPMVYYAKKYLEAYPMLVEEIPLVHWDNPERHLVRCFITRFFSRFAEWWGLAELAGPMDIFNEESCLVRKGKLLGEVFQVADMEG